MGYRSDTAFVIEFDTPENAQNYFSKFKHMETLKWVLGSFVVEEDNKFITFHHDCLKWYEDYEDIQILISMYKEAVNANGFVGYAFNRLGEEYDDCEEDYVGDNSWNYIIHTRRLDINI